MESLYPLNSFLSYERLTVSYKTFVTSLVNNPTLKNADEALS